jgi:hypothetical protein
MLALLPSSDTPLSRFPLLSSCDGTVRCSCCLPGTLGQTFKHGLLHRCQRVFGPASMREIPSHDLPLAAVDHAHQVRPAHRWPRPDLGHVRLPDLIRLRCFHTSPFFLPSCSQTPRAHQQHAFAHHPLHSLAIHTQPFLSLQPPRHPPIAIRQLLSARHLDLLIVG